VLVSLFRTGPLRHYLAKGYVATADRVGDLLADLVARPPALPAPNGVPLRLRVHPDRGTVWLDTGPQWLLDPGHRRALVTGLAEGTAATAAAVARRGGALVPSGWMPAAGGPGWLCADLHAVEVRTDVQRELCSNLLRRYVPELIAVAGRAAFSPEYVDRAGSRRLAEATDHVPTRYLASASATHIDRVRDSLRRDAGVARLELMDVNPLGSSTVDTPTVEVRCLDAQVLPVDTVAQALLVQAIAMRARRMEQEGRRVPEVSQALLERNRSRAIVAGFGARLGDGGKGAPVPVRERVLRLVEELVPELLAMQVEAAELAPVLVGASIAEAQPRAAGTENDLLRLAPPTDRVDRALLDPGWLARDHLTEANTRLGPGSVAVALAYWTDRLRPGALGEPVAAAGAGAGAGRRG
jgi:hypothetical protein